MTTRQQRGCGVWPGRGAGWYWCPAQPPSPPGATLGTAAPPRRSYLSAVHWSHHRHHAAASSNHSASSRCRYSVSGAQSGGGHRCLLCPLYSAEPLYCTVQLPGLVAVVQVASPPARQPRYCIIIMVGAAPAPAQQQPAPAAGNPGVVLWCCPAATATTTNTTAA